MKDQFGVEIKENDRVLFKDQWHDWSFKSFEYGTVIGFTNEFVKIKPDNEEVTKWFWNKTDHIIRNSKYVIVQDDWKDKYYRLAADTDNYKKNLEKRSKAIAETGQNNALMHYIEFMDDLKRAIDAVEDKEGLNIIYNKNINVLKNTFNLVKIDEYLGDNKDIFDPNYHEAIMIQPTTDKELDNHIASVQDGYVYTDGNVLRIQKVVVYKYQENE